MTTITIPVIDTNGRAKGEHTIELERGSDGKVYALTYAGEHYHFSRTGVNIATGKPVCEFAARGDVLRLWVADDLGFAQED